MIHETDHGLPPLTERIINLSGAIARTTKNIFNFENPTTADDIIAERREICEECKYVIFTAGFLSDIYCSKCGCALNIKIKLKDETCPIDRW